jgi:hypothetical protein
MWLDCLMQHLTWQRAGLVLPIESEQMQFRAPSWSWVSIGRGVAFHREVTTPEAEIIDCRVQLMEESSPFGQIHGGQLVIRAPTMSTQKARGPSSFWGHMLDRSNARSAQEGFFYALLGYTHDRGAVGLVLKSVGGSFVRQGIWYGASADVKVWSRVEQTKQILTIT